MRRIELLSENHLSQLSPGADRLCGFPRRISGDQAIRFGSSQVVTQAGTSLRSCSPLIDAFVRAAVLPAKTAALIRPQQQQYCCRLFLKLRILKCVRTTTRLPYFKIPVEAFTPPYFEVIGNSEKVISFFYSLLLIICFALLYCAQYHVGRLF